MVSLLILYLALALGISFLCSLLEASLLSVPDSHVETMIERNKLGAKRLRAMKTSIDRPLAAILTLNTIAHTIGAAGVGAEVDRIWGHAWVAAGSVLLTLLILVLSEIIPKTLGAVHDKRLASFTALTTELLIKATWPIVRACQWISDAVGGRTRQHVLSRDEISSVAKLGRQSGALSDREARTIRNVLALEQVKVRDIMTPRSVVFSLGRDLTVGSVISSEAHLRFARIPITRGDMDSVIGIVHRYRIFEAHRQGRDDATMGDLATPIHAVPETANVASVLNDFMHRQEQLFLAVDEHGGIEGIVTLEDAMETMLGTEIIDETDQITDMRELAQRLQQRRRGRMI